jgi:steroid delta-isomerase-like uncharacterized protein
MLQLRGDPIFVENLLFAEVVEMLPKDQQSRIDEFVKALNQHDLQAFQSFYAEDCKVIDPEYPSPLRGRDAVRKDFEKTLAEYPDIKYTLTGVMVSGDRVAVELIARGTHLGNTLELPIAAFQKINNEGLVVEDRRYYDMALVMQQLGRKAA